MPYFSFRALIALLVAVLHAALLTACGGGSDAPADPVLPPVATAPVAPVPVPDLAPVLEPAPAPVPEPAPTPVPVPTPTPEPEPEPIPGPAPDAITLATALTPLVAGTLNSVQYFPAVGSGTGATISGVGCASTERYHIHAMISFYRDGVRLGIPAHIGLNGCTYEMHTHDATTGVVHIETDVQKIFFLGQFFALWGQTLSRGSAAGIAGPVRYYTIDNGVLSLYTGEPALLVLTAHREVLIVTGKAPTVVPRYDWASTEL